MGESLGHQSLEGAQPVARQDRLEVALHRGESRPAQGIHRPGFAIGGDLGFADVGASADALALSEAHGTGTALGDPIEAGSPNTSTRSCTPWCGRASGASSMPRLSARI